MNMLILHEGEFLHTDSSTDVLEHHGVKGMKWGKRTVGYAGSLGKAYVNQFVHPILSRKAYLSSSSKSSVGSMIRTKRSLDYRNKLVDAQVKSKKQNKQAKKEYRKVLRDNAMNAGKGIDKVTRSWEAKDNLAKGEYKKKLVDRKNINIRY